MNKKLLFTILIALVSLSAFANGPLLEGLSETNYQLFEIDKKAGTFLRFDTRNGELCVEQIGENIRDYCYEYAVENEKRVQLIYTTDKLVPGRFVLTKLEDQDSYLLFDTQEGKLWVGTLTVLRQRWSISWRPFVRKR